MSELPQNPFWMVYGIDCNAPTCRHTTREEATTEAKRLARRHAGIPFVILEAVGAVVKDDIKTVTFTADRDEDIPF